MNDNNECNIITILLLKDMSKYLDLFGVRHPVFFTIKVSRNLDAKANIVPLAVHYQKKQPTRYQGQCQSKRQCHFRGQCHKLFFSLKGFVGTLY